LFDAGLGTRKRRKGDGSDRYPDPRAFRPIARHE
jgi:hypothetical protein